MSDYARGLEDAAIVCEARGARDIAVRLRELAEQARREAVKEAQEEALAETLARSEAVKERAFKAPTRERDPTPTVTRPSTPPAEIEARARENEKLLKSADESASRGLSMLEQARAARAAWTSASRKADAIDATRTGRRR